MLLLWLTVACGEDDEAGNTVVARWLEAGMPEHWSDQPISQMQVGEVSTTADFLCWRWDSPEGPGISVGQLQDGELAWVDSFHGELGSGEPSPGIRSYQKAWNLPNERHLHVAEGWAEEGRWVDPVADISGRGALEEHIYTTMTSPLTKRFTFVELGGADVQDGRFRFHWDMRWKRSERSVFPGWDYGRLDESGQISLLVGCWER